MNLSIFGRNNKNDNAAVRKTGIAPAWKMFWDDEPNLITEVILFHEADPRKKIIKYYYLIFK